MKVVWYNVFSTIFTGESTGGLVVVILPYGRGFESDEATILVFKKISSGIAPEHSNGEVKYCEETGMS